MEGPPLEPGTWHEKGQNHGRSPAREGTAGQQKGWPACWRYPAATAVGCLGYPPRRRRPPAPSLSTACPVTADCLPLLERELQEEGRKCDRGCMGSHGAAWGRRGAHGDAQRVCWGQARSGCAGDHTQRIKARQFALSGLSPCAPSRT